MCLVGNFLRDVLVVFWSFESALILVIDEDFVENHVTLADKFVDKVVVYPQNLIIIGQLSTNLGLNHINLFADLGVIFD